MGWITGIFLVTLFLLGHGASDGSTTAATDQEDKSITTTNPSDSSSTSVSTTESTTTADSTTSTPTTSPTATTTTTTITAITHSPEEEAVVFLTQYNAEAREVNNREMTAEFAYKTNITDETEAEMILRQAESARFDRDQRNKSLAYNDTSLSEDTKRQLWLIRHIGVSALPEEKSKELNAAISEMEGIYGKAEVCLDKNKCLELEPDLTRIMANSRDYDELLKVWKGWRDATGPKMKQNFTHFVQLSNQGVKSLGYKDTGDEWLSDYESETFEEDLLTLFEEIRPLYEQLHAYVRRRLKTQYGEDKFPASGHIPAHLLGNMWAQHWNNILDIVLPYPDKPSMDVTEEMVKQQWNVTKMFTTAEDFFVSLGMDPMTDVFWNKSMLEKPTDGREVVCHASASDLRDKEGEDFRIKMCTDITQEDLKTVHHEMGHIEYYMQYKNQSVVYRGGANPGFHEAVGDLMALSAQTPEHLKKLGLLKEVPKDNETDINFLMKMALDRVAFLPFGYLIDQWRFSVFRGDTTPITYNTDWWNMRCRYQGISPPIPRSENDFDPGAKYHVPANVEYTRYFVSFIIQFQFHKAACDAARWTGPLHRCDIYNNTAAGKLIRGMLQMGLSRPWPEAMKKMTGQEKMDAKPLLQYFKPLYDFLVKENKGDYSWRPSCPTAEELKPKHEGNAGERTHFPLYTLLVVPLVRLQL